MNLFGDAYSGEILVVSDETDAQIGRLFPEVDRFSEYRGMDSWLLTVSARKRPRNVKRFVLNWCRRAARQERNRAKREQYKERMLKREINVGGMNY